MPAVPSVSNVSPRDIKANTPTDITITGSNLGDVTKVYLGSLLKMPSSTASAGRVTVSSGNLPVGSYTVSVMDKWGQRGSGGNITATAPTQAAQVASNAANAVAQSKSDICKQLSQGVTSQYDICMQAGNIPTILPTPSTTPTITSISPSRPTAGQYFNLLIYGTNFINVSRVVVGVVPVTFTVGSVYTQISAPSVKVDYAGPYVVRVERSDGKSAQGTITISSPLPSPPQISGVSPSRIPAGTQTTITLSGNNFTNIIAVYANGEAYPFKVINSNRIDVTIPQTTPVGILSITVKNGQNATSNVVGLDIYKPTCFDPIYAATHILECAAKVVQAVAPVVAPAVAIVAAPAVIAATVVAPAITTPPTVSQMESFSVYPSFINAKTNNTLTLDLTFKTGATLRPEHSPPYRVYITMSMGTVQWTLTAKVAGTNRLISDVPAGVVANISLYADKSKYDAVMQGYPNIAVVRIEDSTGVKGSASTLSIIGIAPITTPSPAIPETTITPSAPDATTPTITVQKITISTPTTSGKANRKGGGVVVFLSLTGTKNGKVRVVVRDASGTELARNEGIQLTAGYSTDTKITVPVPAAATNSVASYTVVASVEEM